MLSPYCWHVKYKQGCLMNSAVLSKSTKTRPLNMVLALADLGSANSCDIYGYALRLL